MAITKNLRLIPLEDVVVFPNMGLTLTVEVGTDERVVLVPRHENEFAEVGLIADVVDHVRRVVDQVSSGLVDQSDFPLDSECVLGRCIERDLTRSGVRSGHRRLT